MTTTIDLNSIASFYFGLGYDRARTENAKQIADRLALEALEALQEKEEATLTPTQTSPNPTVRIIDEKDQKIARRELAATFVCKRLEKSNGKKKRKKKN